MGGMPANIAKGRFFSVIDKVVNTQDRTKIITDLRSSASLADILKSYAGTIPVAEQLDQNDYEHLKKDWFGDPQTPKPPRWWPDKQTEAIVREGLIQAVTRAQELKLPIDTLWICVGRNVEVVSIPSGEQLTVLVFTPPIAAEAVAKDHDRVWEREANPIHVTTSNVEVRNPSKPNEPWPGITGNVTTSVCTVELLREKRPHTTY